MPPSLFVPSLCLQPDSPRRPGPDPDAAAGQLVDGISKEKEVHQSQYKLHNTVDFHTVLKISNTNSYTEGEKVAGAILCQS